MVVKTTGLAPLPSELVSAANITEKHTRFRTTDTSSLSPSMWTG